MDGVAGPLSGHVSYVGVMNTSGTSGATATYPVTVVLDPTTTPLFDGAGVSTAITVGSVNGVLTVPISAVHQIGTLQTVSVYAKGKVTVERVTVGVSGVDRVQVLTGLSAGQRVVLADISAPVPSNSTLTGRRFGGAGGSGRRRRARRHGSTRGADPGFGGPGAAQPEPINSRNVGHAAANPVCSLSPVTSPIGHQRTSTLSKLTERTVRSGVGARQHGRVGPAAVLVDPFGPGPDGAGVEVGLLGGLAQRRHDRVLVASRGPRRVSPRYRPRASRPSGAAAARAIRR